MTKLIVSSIGPASSVQDGGRPGAQRYGLTPSGAVDRLALAAANCLVGNPLFAAAVEVGPFGASFTSRDGAVRLAIAGAAREAKIGERSLPLGLFGNSTNPSDATGTTGIFAPA